MRASNEHGSTDDRVVVMKFGGTSVAGPEGREAVSARVAAALDTGKAPVVVVSAMGRIGSPYATDTLLGLLSDLPTDPRERDLLAGVGETVSAVVLAHELRARGIAAVALTGAEAGIVTDGVHGGAAITEIHTGLLDALIAEGKVPVVCGFQGIAPDGSLATLGRGGSDTTACALGVALAADEVEIYTDVDGVMTTDPRTCGDARVIDVVRADELFQMARSGSKVVHTPAAELALASGMALRVRNTYSDHPGTRVADIAAFRPDGVATAVTHAEGVCRFTVDLGAAEGTVEHMGQQARLYRALADAAVSLDMFTPLGSSLVFSVSCSHVETTAATLRSLDLPYTLTEGLAKVTLVGAGMHGVPGVMALVSECLADAGVTVLQTADSHTTISVVVVEPHARRAVDALHRGFDLSGVRVQKPEG